MQGWDLYVLLSQSEWFYFTQPTSGISNLKPVRTSLHEYKSLCGTPCLEEWCCIQSTNQFKLKPRYRHANLRSPAFPRQLIIPSLLWQTPDPSIINGPGTRISSTSCCFSVPVASLLIFPSKDHAAVAPHRDLFKHQPDLGAHPVPPQSTPRHLAWLISAVSPPICLSRFSSIPSSLLFSMCVCFVCMCVHAACGYSDHRNQKRV